jgi:hypothetical protein
MDNSHYTASLLLRHTSGNMWVARCSYIRHLIDPRHFESKMDTVEGETSIEALACRGLKRYSAEHWIHSHPWNMPCDLSTDSRFVWNYDRVPSPDFIKELAPAPRFPFNTYKLDLCQRFGISIDERIAEYNKLYNLSPPSTWWGWKFYQAVE